MSDLATTAQEGDRGKTLRALRDRLAKEIDETNSARDVAALSRQLTDVLDKIADLPDSTKASPADELRRRREERRARSASAARAEGSV